MTKREQITFVRGISKSIADDMIAAIRAGKTPDTWDGHELRVWLAQRAQASASVSRIISDPRSSRSRDYRNHLLTVSGL